MTPTTSDKKRDCVIDLLSSDDDENENETETDHNDDDNNNPDDNDNDNDNDDSSFDSDNDLATAAEDDDDDACERKKERFWWSSPSSSSSSGRQHLLREERLHHLEKNVTNTSNKVLQLMLWDVGFNFNIKPHQFEAIRFVAGLKSTFPCVVVVVVLDIDNDNDNDNNSTSTTSLLLLNDTGVSARLRALQLAGEGFNDSPHHNDQKHRSSVLLPTRGLLLADEMGMSLSASTVWWDLTVARRYGNDGAHVSEEQLHEQPLAVWEETFVPTVRIAMATLAIAATLFVIATSKTLNAAMS